jgi:hypothetical protein
MPRRLENADDYEMWIVEAVDRNSLYDKELMKNGRMLLNAMKYHGAFCNTIPYNLPLFFK